MNNIEELSGFEKIILQAIEEAHSLELDEAISIIEDDRYIFYDVEDFDELIDILIDEGLFGEVPPKLIGYLDYKKLARDLEYDGYRMTSVGIIYVY